MSSSKVGLKWGKIVIGISLAASVLGILGFIFQVDDIVSVASQKKEKFDAAFKRSLGRMGSEFMSSHNYLISIIPNNIYQTSDPNHWHRVSYSWNKHMGRMTDFYSELAKCLEEQDCEPGDTKEKACSNAIVELNSHKYIQDALEKIEGINIDHTGGNAPFDGVFGPSVSVPIFRNLEVFVRLGCS